MTSSMSPHAGARRAHLLVLSLLALGLVAAPSASAASARAERAAAERTLREVRIAASGRGNGEDLSRALRDLANRRAALSARDRRAADSILARPTDSPADPGDAESGADYTVAEETPLCSDLFCVHYVGTTDDAPVMTDASGRAGVPDYVERVLAVFEEVYIKENSPAPTGLGWPKAPSDGNLGGGDKGQLDVYLADIGGKNLYGYVATDPGQTAKEKHSYQVMDDDYAEFDGDKSLQVTAAHEYHHVLQNGINSTLDAWVFEATATWMEEKVYPEINDYFQYLGPWSSGVALSKPLTTFDSTQGSPQENFQYGSAVWNHFLENRFGDNGKNTVLTTWTGSDAQQDGLAAYDRAITSAGGGSFGRTFAEFAASVAEWKSTPERFGPDVTATKWPDVARAGSLGLGADATTRTLDHASFAFLDVTGASGDIRLEATFPKDVHGAVALIGRSGAVGSGPLAGDFVEAPAGGAVSVQLANAGSFQRVTAVLVNADRRHGPQAENGDYPWTADGSTVSARVARVETQPPPDSTAPDTVIGSGPSGTVSGGSHSFAFSSTEEGSAFACSLDGGAFEACTSPKAYAGLASGGHTFSVRATDAAGNADATPATRSFTISAPPEQTPTPTPTQTSTPTPSPTPSPTPGPTPVAPVAPVAKPIAPAPAVADTAGPVVLIPAKNKSLKATRAGVVPFAFGPAQENTTGVLSLKSSGKVRATPRGAKKTLALGAASFQALKGQDLVIRVKLGGKAQKALKRLKRLKVQATVTLRDAKGNATIETYTFTLKAPGR